MTKRAKTSSGRTKKARSTPEAPPGAKDGGARFARVVAAFAAEPSLSAVAEDYASRKLAPSRAFGSNGLKVNGKLFALVSSKGEFVVKLPKDRVSALVDSGQGRPFDPGHGRLMKEWLSVTSPRTSWVELAKEAYAFVGAAGRHKAR